MVEREGFKPLVTTNLPIHPYAHLVIEIEDSGRNVRAGEKIQGVLKVRIDGLFDAASISMRFSGIENTQFLPEAKDKGKETINIKL